MSLTFLLSMILGPSWRSDWWTVIPRSSSWILMRAQSSAPRLTGLVRYTSYGTAGLDTEEELEEQDEESREVVITDSMIMCWWTILSTPESFSMSLRSSLLIFAMCSSVMSFLWRL